ncbi:hypothetical protein QAD02_000523 [Eretmocerus hayati]|uniref:Uncharacterized protein n=1 Tax=Eretmocerus hayati TaxID=131215 RepID=A0ACC2NDH8_9HYME|nr:hypothetical protein QAD02_000523 [Eretmocerus hayati]
MQDKVFGFLLANFVGDHKALIAVGSYKEQVGIFNSLSNQRGNAENYWKVAGAASESFSEYSLFMCRMPAFIKLPGVNYLQSVTALGLPSSEHLVKIASSLHVNGV